MKYLSPIWSVAHRDSASNRSELSSQFPQNTLQAMRILTHMREVDGPGAIAWLVLAQRFFRAVWANDENLGDPTVVERCVREACGADQVSAIDRGGQSVTR
jgi:2-hydroxychromene-2-carboxylate isomerase